ncbi:hypothetical protein CYMTET_9187 [Cymbomonas tetramitiformis]|uniref:Calpain catalytic domain-containing protein n=1 Tax=Cymbomonas tetramitiformis TaxID=36881 RepID=A0AAE0GRP4_9CHLO|nr:hypothetical protein CYMTET_9187 [Cymbomonas tetramitiformis]
MRQHPTSTKGYSHAPTPTQDTPELLLHNLNCSRIVSHDMVFVDTSFGPNDTTLGKGLVERCTSLQWRRAHEILPSAQPGQGLFHGIDPTDIAQGQLGDCWLLSSISSLAEFPEVVKYSFVTKDTNLEGKYVVRIYDPKLAAASHRTTIGAPKAGKQEWIEITVDDYLPCSNGKPAFAAAPGGDFWVCILEKAYAKYVGSYEKLSGGFPALAFQCMTGCKSTVFMFDEQVAREVTFGETSLKDIAAGKRGTTAHATGNVQDANQLWESVKRFDELDYLMVLASKGTDEYTETGADTGDWGLVGGHAYSLIRAVKVGRFRMCRIRNPWGDFEWGGDWSDRSPLWKKHPEVKAACNPILDKDDGIFWMCFEDVLKLFMSLTVCQLQREGESKAES